MNNITETKSTKNNHYGQNLKIMKVLSFQKWQGKSKIIL